MLFGGGRIKLDKELLKKAAHFAQIAGYSSVEEFITDIIEKELSQVDEGGSDEEIRKKLQGLGYIN